MRPSLRVLCALVAALPASGAGGGAAERDAGPVALQAGVIHLVAGGDTLEDGTILVRGGRIEAVGRGIELPAGTRVVDFGPDAEITPGLVAANSLIGPGQASERTADPSVRAVDNFDPESPAWELDLAGGVTTLYLPPARDRLIAGQAAVIKLAGEGERVLLETAALHGSIGADARSVGGYWEPPVPATVSTGLGVEQHQLPHSTMGATLALRELLDEARAGRDSGEYGPGTPAEVAEHLRRGTPWRLGARTEAEIRAAIELARSERIPLVIEGADEAAGLAGEIREVGASVVVTVDVAPGAPGRDFGRSRDARWPSYAQAAALARAGVSFAIATPNGLRARDLRFAAAVASRGGLDGEQALHAITLGAAEVLGVADRVGSIEVGKDADFAVFNGPPMEMTSSLLSTWIEGVEVFALPGKGGRAGAKHAAEPPRPRSVVIEADELHLGDGQVLRPGAVLIVDGVIAEVGPTVGHPLGAEVARGRAAMPGLIDALGHLGLEGAGKIPDSDQKLARLIEPGDFADRRVARAGVTTVVLAPRGASGSGAPMMAYKPAAASFERMVVEDPTALRLAWSDTRERAKSGEEVRELLEKVVQYDAKWKEYEQALAEWVPPEDGEAEKQKKGEEEQAGESGEQEDGKDGDESKAQEGDSKEKKEKREKKDAEGQQGDPLIGVWDAEIVVPPAEEAQPLRLRLTHEGGKVGGTLRSAALSDSLVLVTGTFDQGRLEIVGLGSRGPISIKAVLGKDVLEGQVLMGELAIELEAKRTSQEYQAAKRPEMRKHEAEEPPQVKGKPKSPGVDEKLEPFRAALRGEKAVVVEVDRELEILDCVQAFEAVGIRPVLYGAADAWRVADQIRGRVAGVIPGHQPLHRDPREGLAGWRNVYQELAGHGIPVAFHSDAEEGASELWLQAGYCVSLGLSPGVALRALTSDSAAMLGIADRVGRLAQGLDGDVLLLDGPPLDPATSVLRVWVAGEEIR